MFSTGRAFEQIRNSVAYPNLNVKIPSSHAGISTGEDSANSPVPRRHWYYERLSLIW